MNFFFPNHPHHFPSYCYNEINSEMISNSVRGIGCSGKNYFVWVDNLVWVTSESIIFFLVPNGELNWLLSVLSDLSVSPFMYMYIYICRIKNFSYSKLNIFLLSHCCQSVKINFNTNDENITSVLPPPPGVLDFKEAPRKPNFNASSMT